MIQHPATCEWSPASADMPSHEILIWSGGRAMVGVLVKGTDEKGDWQDFLEARTSEILPWPSHWCLLPEAPE